LESLSSLILGNKYPVNFAVPNSSSASSVEEGYAAETDLEAITLKTIKLGVELRRGRLIKEVLIHLRGALQTVHALSFEFVLRSLVSAAEEQVKAAQAKVLIQDLSSLDLDDEFCAVEEKEVVTLWLRFYWEVLRMVLEISRNNSRLELVYHHVALQAFQFCRIFSRKSEFRRLSEMIRYHLALSVKYPGQVNAVPLSTSTASHQLALELRFNQLTLACDLELWQEAFRTVEDIYGLQLLARKSVRQLTAPEYFDKLARIFAKSDNFLFLAATLSRQPKLERDQEEILLMATLAAPIQLNCDAMQAERLAQIIGLSTVPSRASLLRTIEQRGLLTKVAPEISSLFSALSTFSVSKGVSALEAIAAGPAATALKPFIRGCFENLLTGKVQEILKSRDSISIEEISDLLFIEHVRKNLIPKFNLEMFLLSGNFKGIKIDHMTREIKIDRSLFLANPEPFDGVEASLTWCHLQTEMRKLLKVNDEIKLNGSISALLKAEHESNLERRSLIEKRKEQLEQAAAEKERQETRERAIKIQQEAEAERLRQAEEIARRDRERLEKERAEIRKVEAEKRVAEQEKMKEAAGARLNREKIAAAATRLDYLERALRAEEIPLLETDYLKQKEADRAAYDSRCKLISEVARAKYTRDLELKQKFIQSEQFESDYKGFFALARERREKEFEARQAQAQIDLEDEKEKRRARIAAEKENRRKIEAEREAARQSMTAASVTATPAAEPVPSSTGKYVPPSKQGGWRREPVAVSVDVPVINAVEPVTPAATPTANIEEPKKNVFVPRHKRQAN
jgi:translation initiation factor 3 subunit A